MFQTTNQMRWHIVTEGIRSIGLNIGSMIWGWQEKETAQCYHNQDLNFNDDTDSTSPFTSYVWL